MQNALSDNTVNHPNRLAYRSDSLPMTLNLPLFREALRTATAFSASRGGREGRVSGSRTRQRESALFGDRRRPKRARAIS